MAITKDSGRQYPLFARVDFTYADLGTAIATIGTNIVEAFDIPANARVIGGALVVTTAWVGPTAATVDVGDDGDINRWTASPITLKTAGRTALTVTGTLAGYVYPAANTIDLDVVQSVAVSTAGVGYMEIEYVIDDRVQENER